MKRHLVIFVKAPRIGQVKSRLAKDIGRVNAWVFFKNNMTDLIRRVSDPRWSVSLYVTPDDYAGSSRFWPSSYPRFKQGRGDLGERMQRAFEQNRKGPVVIIGSDIPSIDKNHITDAFDALKRAPVVIGPAHDGGYWLIGQRRLPRVYNLFNGVRWSTEDTLSDTVNNAPDKDKIIYLDTLRDIDYGHDLDIYKNSG